MELVIPDGANCRRLLQVNYQTALAAVFIEGWVFVLLAITGLRQRLINLVPKPLMLATTAGIGLQLAFIGLQNAEGFGISTYSRSTLVTLGAALFTHLLRELCLMLRGQNAGHWLLETPRHERH